ncbi:MAG: C39 family peptidase [Anaerolineaceae bacterium]|nr:C39 family peptidase [Anaerolineaceae bacterium]
MNKNQKRYLLVIPAVVLFGLFVLMLPPVRERVFWRVDLLRTQISAFLFPQEEARFVPQEQVDAIVQATMQAYLATPVAPSATPTPEVAAASPTPAPTLPPSVTLSGVRYEDQHGMWNYCAPATLSMALSYWGWHGTRMDTGKAIKPFDEDLNVMPYEMVDYVNEQTEYAALARSGGTLELARRLVAGGFPVLAEKGPIIHEVSTGQDTWMGHYTLLTGYDDASQEFISQDSYYSADYPVPYASLEEEWRSFNYVFVVVYPHERETELLSLLGEYGDEMASEQIALQKADEEIAGRSGIEQFFAYYNRGTSLVDLQDYSGAAAAYDQAFLLLSAMDTEQVPKKVMRIVWYQTGPYFAYFYTGRYQDVIDLAGTVMDMATRGPFLEESFYWRARAKVALGDTQGAIDDLNQSLVYHPGFPPSVQLLQDLGVPS